MISFNDVRKRLYTRRLAVESLEQRAFLSATTGDEPVAPLVGEDEHAGDVHLVITEGSLTPEHGAYGWDFVDEGGGPVADIGFDADGQPNESELSLVTASPLLYWNGRGSKPDFRPMPVGLEISLEGLGGSIAVTGTSDPGARVLIGQEDNGVVHSHLAASIGVNSNSGLIAFYAKVESSDDATGATGPIAFVLNFGRSEAVHDKGISFLEDRPIILDAGIENAPGTYKSGDTIEFKTTFSTDVIIRGKPQIPFTLGGESRLATYASHDSAARTSTFAYQIKRTDPIDLDGLVIGQVLKMGGRASIKAIDSGMSVLSVLPSIDASDVNVDTSVPSITSIVAVTTDGTYGIGSVLQFNAIVSKPVTVTGLPMIGFTSQRGARLGGALQYVAASSTSTSLRFEYTVQAGDAALRGLSLDRAFSSLGNFEIQDLLGNDILTRTPRAVFNGIRVAVVTNS